MCECRDCDNFKAKKRKPQVGDSVKHTYDSAVGVVIAVHEKNTTNFQYKTTVNEGCSLVWYGVGNGLLQSNSNDMLIIIG